MIPENAPMSVSWEEKVPPNEEERRAIDKWAAARGTRLLWTAAPVVAPSREGTTDDVERLFGEARSAYGEGRAEEARERVESARVIVDAHPEWPQAAWLLAEALRLSGHRRDASVLDGERAAGIADPKTTSDGAPPPLEGAVVSIEKEREGDEVFVDGLRFESYAAPPSASGGLSRSLRAGRHALLVLRGGRVIHAAWTEVNAFTSSLRMPSAQGACSAADLKTGGPDCAAWIRIRRDGIGLTITTCAFDRCGTTTPLWHASKPSASDKPKERGHASTWATVALVGAGVALFSVGVLYVSGTFERETAPTRIVSGGVRPASFHFDL